MAFAPPPGVTPLPKAGAQNLRGALSAVSGPANPNTPDNRTDPRERTLLDLQRIRRALERAMEVDDLDDPIYKINKAAHGLYERLLAGVDPMIALQTAMTGLTPPQPPSHPPMPPGGGMGAAPPPGGPQAGPGPSAGPPPGAPVSPGPPPG